VVATSFNLLERALVEQKGNPLTGRHFALFVLAFTALGAAALFGEPVAPLELGQVWFDVHGGGL
jgi:hypothetical protein